MDSTGSGSPPSSASSSQARCWARTDWTLWMTWPAWKSLPRWASCCCCSPLGSLGEAGLLTVVWSVAKAILAVLLILVAACDLVPRLLVEVVRSRSRELFVITIILVCLGIAWLSSLAGLSLALGAFIAGLIISESEYSHQAMARSEEHTSELQSQSNLVCRLLLEKKKKM